jgi:Uma2 family endonuclease
MAIDPSYVAHASFPGLRPEVIAGYLDAPEHMVAEVVDGELFLMPRPRPRHAHASSRLIGRLRPYSDPLGDEPGGWLILGEPELHLGPRPDIIDPDLAGWHRERMPRLPDEAAITTPPDWVCEVLSDRTEALDRGRKMRVFRRENVGHVWLVSPELRTVEVYRLENGRYSLLDTFEGEQLVRAEPFELVELALGALWNL